MAKFCYYYMKFIVQKIVVDASVIMSFLSNQKSLINDIIRSGEFRLMTSYGVKNKVLKRADKWRDNWPNNDLYQVTQILHCYIQIRYLRRNSSLYHTALGVFGGNFSSNTDVLVVAIENNLVMCSQGNTQTGQSSVPVITRLVVLYVSWRVLTPWEAYVCTSSWLFFTLRQVDMCGYEEKTNVKIPSTYLPTLFYTTDWNWVGGPCSCPS
jgi:hypothetical protein